MIVSSVPCPPLPMVGTWEGSGGASCFSSHSLLQQVLAHASDRCSPETQRKFTEGMSESEKALFRSLDNLQTPLCAHKVYECFCVYMRSLLLASPYVHKDIRFFPLEHPCRGDHIHSVTCDHARAQDVLFSDSFKGRSISPSSYHLSSYTDIVSHYAQRIVSVTEQRESI